MVRVHLGVNILEIFLQFEKYYKVQTLEMSKKTLRARYVLHKIYADESTLTSCCYEIYTK